MRRFLAPIVTLALGSAFALTSLAVPASAGSTAASVSVAGGALTFVAGDFQTDRVFINVTNTPGTWRVSDNAAGGMTPGSGCSTVDATDVDCSGGISSAVVRLRDGDDVFSYGNPGLGLPTHVFGGTGSDSITTETGADRLHGGQGGDILVGMGGGDVYHGGRAGDTVNYDPTATFLNRHEGVTVTTDGIANDGFAGDDDNVEGDVELIRGTGFDDSLTIGAGVLYGGVGNDTLTMTSGGGAEYGDFGSDLLHGGPGHTLLSGGANDDTLFSADTSSDHDNCGTGTGDTVTADAHDTIVHCENIHLTP